MGLGLGVGVGGYVHSDYSVPFRLPSKQRFSNSVFKSYATALINNGDGTGTGGVVKLMKQRVRVK